MRFNSGEYVSHLCAQAGRVARTVKAVPDDQSITSWGLIADETDVVFRRWVGMWLLDNGEYSGPIWFCPICGVDLYQEPM